ncbi:uncharacterized protein LOC117331225 [Pecten maximus]|uniref:uncharacterized protein LOC117331225 n=1 Tax=Pecten maximus TaxID=6579 RepID=UPI001458974E|nr:uncharacterized protein LOC117331225 [Pecten maximus]
MADLTMIASASYTFLSFFNEDEDDTVETVSAVCTKRNERTRIPFYAETIVKYYEEQEFHSHFRMTRSCFEILIDLIHGPGKVPVYHEQGRKPISIEKQVLITIWYLANKDSHREIADHFDATVSSIARTKARVIIAIMELLKEFIVWPTNTQSTFYDAI